MDKKKILIITLIITVLVIAGCQGLTGGEKKSPLKSDKDATSAVSNFTDTASTTVETLSEISRSLGR